MFCCSLYGRYWKCDIKRSTPDKLAGKKIGVKDNVAVAGVPMMNGSKILEGYTPEFDATIIIFQSRHGRGRIVVGFTTIHTISAYHH